MQAGRHYSGTIYARLFGRPEFFANQLTLKRSLSLTIPQNYHFLPFYIMITLTEAAARKIGDLKSEIADDSKYLRLSVETGGCSGLEYGMSFDVAKEDDVELDSAGVHFIIDKESLTSMKGCEVDFDDGLHGKGFEIRNPNAKSTCGCGRSFS